MKRNTTRLLLALALAAAMALTSCSGGEGEGAATTDVGRSGGELDAKRGQPETEGGDIGTMEGQYPPPFSLPDLGGESYSLDDFAGKVVVLDLWATWCPPCRAEIPVLVELQKEYADRGLEVVGIGLDQGGARVLAPFVEEYAVNYTILVGDRSVQEQYKVTGIPTTFFIARDGRIASKHVGFHPSMEESMRAELEVLLGVSDEEA